MQTKTLVIFSSLIGSTFQAIVEACERGLIEARVVGLVCNRKIALVIDRAKILGVPQFVFSDLSEHDRDLAMKECLEQLNPDLVVLAGYMSLIGPEVLRASAGKMVNVHPALLPKFGGKGMYGSHVHRAVIEAGEKESGITVHVVTEKYDEGPILAQIKIPVFPEDRWEDLESRVKNEEKPFYIKTIGQLVSGTLSLAGSLDK